MRFGSVSRKKDCTDQIALISERAREVMIGPRRIPETVDHENRFAVRMFRNNFERRIAFNFRGFIVGDKVAVFCNKSLRLQLVAVERVLSERHLMLSRLRAGCQRKAQSGGKENNSKFHVLIFEGILKMQYRNYQGN